MTLEELKQQLKLLREMLEAVDVDEIERIDLEILEKQVQKEIVVGGFDPLTKLEGLGDVDVSEIEQLIPQVDAVIEDEQKRTELVTKVIGMAKTALRGAGLPML